MCNATVAVQVSVELPLCSMFTRAQAIQGMDKMETTQVIL